MARETRQWTISLPPRLARQAGQLAKLECRTKSELVREALRGYIAQQSVMHAARRQLARNVGKLRLRSWADLKRVMTGRPAVKPRRAVRRRASARTRRRASARPSGLRRG